MSAENRCPACTADPPVTSQRETYLYARRYLCVPHTNLWDAADDRAHGKECPHSPRPCVRGLHPTGGEA